MSVVAWDGRIFAADKAMVCSGMVKTGSKMAVMPDGAVVAWTGSNEHGIAMARWYANGAKEDEFPRFPNNEWTRMIVCNRGDVYWYETLPVKQRGEDRIMAWGAGADFALGAMAAGASAVTAVLIAGQYCDSCGNGEEHYVMPRGDDHCITVDV